MSYFDPHPKSEPYITFTCGCGQTVEEYVDEVPSHNLMAERHSDGDGITTQDVVCPECGEEYEVTIRAHIGGVDARIGDFSQISVEFCDPDEAEREKWEYEFDRYVLSLPIADPYEAYTTSRGELVPFIKAAKNYPENRDAYCRMVFVQQIGMMEAYFSDLIVGLVKYVPKITERAIAKVESLKEINLSLTEVFKEPDIVLNKVVNYLQRLSFHDVAKVNELYGRALGAGLFPKELSDTKEFLVKATKVRHDCVHRNGRNTQGYLHQDVDYDYLIEVGNHIDLVVNSAQRQFKDLIDEAKIARDQDLGSRSDF